jgi:hypothetical protein
VLACLYGDQVNLQQDMVSHGSVSCCGCCIRLVILVIEVFLEQMYARHSVHNDHEDLFYSWKYTDNRIWVLSIAVYKKTQTPYVMMQHV